MNFEDTHNTNFEEDFLEVMNAIRDWLSLLDFDIEKASEHDLININKVIIEKIIAGQDERIVASIILALASAYIRSLIED